MVDIEVSATFVRQFRKLERKEQTRIKVVLSRLREDPFTKRSGADIKALKGTDPPKWRVRVGEFRIIYSIDDDIVRVIEVFKRQRGYREY